MKDTRTWSQAEEVADHLMIQAEIVATVNAIHAQELRDRAIFNMLRAILLKLPAHGARL